MPSEKPSKSEIFVLIGLMALTLIVYANVAQNGFVYDDHFLIVKNKALASDEYFSTIFTHSFAYDTGDEASYKNLAIDYYRPFIRLFFALCYRAFGLNSAYWHLANLFIYLIVVLSCYFLARELTTQRVAALSALLFAVHPLHSESVAYINGSVDTLHAAFFLPAFLLFILSQKELDKKRRAEYLLGSCLLFLAAMLTKELAITLPPLIAIYTLLYSQDNSLKERVWRSAKATLPFLATFICYLLLRLSTYGSLGAKHALSGRLDLQTVLLSAPGVIVEYLKMMLIPIDLNLFRNVPEVSSPASVRFALTASAVALLIVACLRLPARLQMAAAVFFVTLAPALNIGLFPDNRTIQDRYAFISLLGLCVIVAELVLYLYEKAPRLAVSASVAMVLCLCILTVRQNDYWKDNLAIWKRVIDMHPGSATLHCNIASILFYEKRIDEGVGYYKQALLLDPNAACALDGLAGYYYSIGDYKAAIDLWERALVTGEAKDKRGSMMFLAQTYSLSGNNQRALEVLERVISEFPDYTEAHTLHAELKQARQKQD